MPCEFPHDFSALQLAFLCLIYVAVFFGGMAVDRILRNAPTLEIPDAPTTPLCPDERPHSVEPSEQPAGTAHV